MYVYTYVQQIETGAFYVSYVTWLWVELKILMENYIVIGKKTQNVWTYKRTNSFLLLYWPNTFYKYFGEVLSYINPDLFQLRRPDSVINDS